jgi:glutamate-1-semialdehyde 2,1-aminomutase
MSTIIQRYCELHPGSAALHAEAEKVFPDGVTHDVRRFTPFPLYVTHASGSRKWDVDGHEIIDYVMGHGALILGHAHPQVAEAVIQQIRKGTHYGASQELEMRWGQWVQRLIPSAEMVRFTSSGTEATQMAIRLARAFTGRDKLIRFAGHFHGWNDNVVGLAPAEEVTPSAPGVPGATSANQIVLPQNDATEVARTLAEDHDVAAVIVEPTGAHWGAIPLDPSFLTELRQLTQKAGAILIFDEVVTGFRISPGGVQALYGITPDITCLAKILGGGLPGGAVAGRRDLVGQIEFRNDIGWDITKRVAHPGTYNANPLSASAGTTALSLVADGTVHEHAGRLTLRLCQELNRLFRKNDVDGCAYGIASTFHTIVGQACPEPIDGFQWRWDGKPGAAVPGTPPEVTLALRRGLLNRGVDLMGMGGLMSSVHQDADIDRTLAAFEETLRDMRHEEIV